MAPLVTVAVAVFAALSVAGGSPLQSSKAAATGEAVKGLRGGRHLQAVYCSTFQCPDRSTPIDDAGTTACDDDVCDASQCCEAKCSYYQCPERSTPVENADSIVCDDVDSCTDGLCCEAKCSFYQCPSGDTLVEGADDIVCPDVECTDALCCE